MLARVSQLPELDGTIKNKDGETPLQVSETVQRAAQLKREKEEELKE